MRKFLLSLALFASVAFISQPLLGMSANVEVDVNAGDGYYNHDNYYRGYWYGPGWYWGVYINNENDYWHHYHNHYYGENHYHRDRYHEDRYHGGTYHGGNGGGHHGGGGHGGSGR